MEKNISNEGALLATSDKKVIVQQLEATENIDSPTLVLELDTSGKIVQQLETSQSDASPVDSSTLESKSDTSGEEVIIVQQLETSRSDAALRVDSPTLESEVVQTDTSFKPDRSSMSQVESDMALARALQEQETALYLLGIGGGLDDYTGDLEEDEHWEDDFDLDNLSYEELIALGEVVGTVSKGLDPHSVAALERFTFVSDNSDDKSSSDQEQCVVCMLVYDDGDKMLRLPCKHLYHSHCIEQWLTSNKVCPICSFEVASASCSEVKDTPV